MQRFNLRRDGDSWLAFDGLTRDQAVLNKVPLGPMRWGEAVEFVGFLNSLDVITRTGEHPEGNLCFPNVSAGADATIKVPSAHSPLWMPIT
jgi:hypothetical protein